MEIGQHRPTEGLPGFGLWICQILERDCPKDGFVVRGLCTFLLLSAHTAVHVGIQLPQWQNSTFVWRLSVFLYQCRWGSGNQPMWETALCPFLAPCGMCFSEQVLETTEAPLKLTSMCRWFREWKYGLKGTHWRTKWNYGVWTEQKATETSSLPPSLYLSQYCCLKGRRDRGPDYMQTTRSTWSFELWACVGSPSVWDLITGGISPLSLFWWQRAGSFKEISNALQTVL